jgi:hypothetical protein
MGASFQIIQVILRTSIASKTLGWLHFVFYLIGLPLILAGFAWNPSFISIGGSLVVLGIVLYSINILAIIFRVKQRNPFVLGVSLSVISFLVTAALGTWMGLGFAFGVPTLPHHVLFQGHLWFGIGGWLSGLILVFSYKLLPMFYVSTWKLTREVYWIVIAFHAAVWLQFAAAASGYRLLSVIGFILSAVLLIRFAMHAVDIRKKGRGRQPIGAVRIAFYLIPAISFIFLIWSKYEVFDGNSRVTEAFVLLLIVGWFVPTIFSYLSKIVPFLWWGHRFRTGEQKKGAVLLSDMLNERRMTWELAGYLLGIVLVIVGFLSGVASVTGAGCLVSTVFTVAYFLDLLRVARY